MSELGQLAAQKIAAQIESTVIPRAEFRVFGQGIIASLEEKIWNAKASLHSVRDMPVEFYFVSRHSDHANVKVRDALLDIKIKTGDTAEGYEIFQPYKKFTFPVKRQDVQDILSALAVELPLDQEECSISDFLDMVKHSHDLCAVEVKKKRYGFLLDGVICEYAKVWVNGAQIETACCESDTYQKMSSVIQTLGLEGLENVSYIKAIKKIVGF